VHKYSCKKHDEKKQQKQRAAGRLLLDVFQLALVVIMLLQADCCWMCSNWH